MTQKTKFVVFEGVDGSGKSTQAGLLFDRLKNNNKNVILTSEPTTWFAGKLIREIFSGNQPSNDYVVAGLFVADRLHHITDEKSGILSQLATGNDVICDRYVLSSYAYQGVHVNMQWVMQANALASTLLKPNVHVFVDVPPEICMQRIEARKGIKERYETFENLCKVREKYMEAIELVKEHENIVIVDGTRPADEIAEEVFEIYSKL
jgi:dTMP kinase